METGGFGIMYYDNLINATEDLITALLDSVSEDLEGINEVPPYEDMRKRKVLYEKYGKAAEISNRVSERLALSYKARAQLKSARKNIFQDPDLPSTLSSKYKAQLEHQEVVLQDMISALLQRKEGIDSLVRFYSSVQ